MRVITTSIFFNKEQITDIFYDAGSYKQDIEGSLGVSFCWFNVDPSSGYGKSLESSINNIKAFRGFKPIGNDVNLAVDHFLRNSSDRYFSSMEQSIKNPDLVKDVLNQDIVIERSPPSHINFSQAINKSNAAVVIGTYIGSSGSDMHGLILFASVPAGIIVAGSAIGIASALQNGLSSAVSRVFR